MSASNLVKNITVVMIIFCACLPSIISFFSATTSSTISILENRKLSLFPTLSWPMEHYTSDIDQFLNDNFGMRKTGLKINRRLLKLIGDNPSKVVEGRNEWLFLGEVDMRDSFMGTGSITMDALSNWHGSIDSLAEVSKKQGAPFVVTIVPNKIRVYSEFAPYDYGYPGQRRFMNSLLKYSGRSEPIILNIEEALVRRKKDKTLYRKTDTHWTSFGAFTSYTEIMSALNKGRVTPWPVLEEDLLIPATITSKKGDLIRLMGEEKYMSETFRDVTLPNPDILHSISFRDKDTSIRGYYTMISANTRSRPQTIVVIGDSFSNIMVPYLTHSFDRVVRVHHRYGEFDVDLVSSYDPDAILLMPIERFAEIWR